MKPFPYEVEAALSLDDGMRAVLVGRLANKTLPAVEVARNIYLLGPDGSVRWQVHSNFDEGGDPFTSLFLEAGKVRAYRWDGGVYELDLATGEAKPKYLAK